MSRTFIIDHQVSKKCKKNCFYVSCLGRKEIRIWLTILRNIAIKVKTDEVTKYMELYGNNNWKCMYGKICSKVLCQNWACALHFAFWNLVLCQAFLLFFVNQSFQGSQKTELKMQLSLVSKKDTPNFEDMENPFCTNSFFIRFLQNV